MNDRPRGPDGAAEADMHLGVPQDVEQQRIHFRLGAFARIAQEVVELVQGIAAVGAVGPVSDGKRLVRIDVHQLQVRGLVVSSDGGGGGGAIMKPP